MGVKIRKARKEDIPHIRNLVVELAIFEKEPNAVLIDNEYYLKSFENGLFSAMVADLNGEIVGMAIYYMSFSTWKGKMLWLEDLLVSSDYRRKGIGQKIFDAVIMEAKSENAALMKWQVLDWNEIALNFYHKNEATIETDWWNGKIVF